MQQQQQQSTQQSYEQQYAQQQQQYQRRYQQQQAKLKTDEFKWPFDPNDPYDVIGIKRGATSKEISDAFRKQMLQHHPDTQPNASEAQKRRSVERTKLISEAYRKIKQEMKRP
jgi:DnaJ-class molecular chaperone